MGSSPGLGKLSLQDNQVQCRRCGFIWTVNAEKRGRKDLLCVSCRVKPAEMIQYGKLRCIPHKGRLDQNLNPVDDEGNLIFSGERICGHKDCVNVAHIVAD